MKVFEFQAKGKQFPTFTMKYPDFDPKNIMLTDIKTVIVNDGGKNHCQSYRRKTN